MGKVIQLRKNVVNAESGQPSGSPIDRVTHGVIEMRMTDEGSLLSVEGIYADRLQFAGYTLVKALNEISERICAAGTAGFTHSGPIQTDLEGSAPEHAKLYSLPLSEKERQK